MDVMADLSPTLLRAFLAVCRHLNFTRAAEELALSQPAVSRQIQRLERDVGVRLFERIGKTLHLTDAGRTMAQEATRLLGDAERVAEAVRAHDGPGHGSLRIGASTTPGYYFLPALLGSFHARFPDVELHYSVANTLQIERSILSNDLDLGFVGGHLSSVDLRVEPLVDDEIVAFAAESHPLAQRKRVQPRHLAENLAVTREVGSATRELFEKVLSECGVRLGRRIELGCPEMIKAVVAAGLGFSYLTARGLEAEPRDPRLQRVPVIGMAVKRTVTVVRHKHKYDSTTMQDFLRLASDLVRS